MISMGEYEAQYGMDDDHDWARSATPREAPVGQWITRDGRQLEIYEMSTAHLRNAISFFVNRHGEDHPKIKELEAELARR